MVNEYLKKSNEIPVGAVDDETLALREKRRENPSSLTPAENKRLSAESIRERAEQLQKERREKLADALDEVERHLNLVEAAGGKDVAETLRSLLPKQDQEELKKRPQMPERDAEPFFDRETRDAGRSVMESMARRTQSNRGLSRDQSEQLMRETARADDDDMSSSESSVSGNASRLGGGAYLKASDSGLEGKVERDQLEVRKVEKKKKEGEDEEASADRVPVSFRTRVERYFKKLADQ